MKTKIVVVKKEASQFALFNPLLHVVCCAGVGMVLAGYAMLDMLPIGIACLGCAFIADLVVS